MIQENTDENYTTDGVNWLRVAGPNSWYQNPLNAPAGFFSGLWHGIIAPIIFFVSLFMPGVRIYETRNNGRWYDFGFMLGVGGFAGGAHSAA